MPKYQRSPSHSEVLAVRQKIQDVTGWGSDKAKRWCADQVHSHMRTWQKWESGESLMHPGLWELAQTKCIPEKP